jgi:hypothetical protein
MCKTPSDFWKAVNAAWESLPKEKKAPADDWAVLPMLNPDPNWKPRPVAPGEVAPWKKEENTSLTTR